LSGNIVIFEGFINPDTIRLIVELEQTRFQGMLYERGIENILREDTINRLTSLYGRDPELHRYVTQLLNGGFPIIRMYPDGQSVTPDFNAHGFITAINYINNYLMEPEGQFNYIDDFWSGLL